MIIILSSSGLSHMTVPWSLYFFKMKWVAVLKTEFMVDSFFRNELGDLAHGLSLYYHRKIIRSDMR